MHCRSSQASQMAAHRFGVTMIELVTTIGIIALLLALITSAVQSARESARRLQCQNNLHQLLVATQSHHTTHGSLPSLYNGTSLKYPLREWDLFHMHSWRVELLPFMEQQVFKDQLHWDKLATAEENLPIARTRIPSLICPSGGDPNDLGEGLKHEFFPMPADGITPDKMYSVARSDYDAMAAIQNPPDPLPTGENVNAFKYAHWGIWGWPVFDRPQIVGMVLRGYRAGKFRDVTDGLSNTIAIVERNGKPIHYKDGKPHPTPENPEAVYPGQVGWSASNTFAWSVNGPGIGVNQDNAAGIYSFHSGGANVSLADGSVHFLSDATDFETLVKLYARSDGGIPEEFLGQ